MNSMLKEKKYLDYLSKLYAESTLKKGNTIVDSESVQMCFIVTT